MPSVEAAIKSQFEQIFAVGDWQRFKKIAESNLAEAAFLRTQDMRVESKLRLLARNARKRLLIGVGTELLLKAVYLKLGYAINQRTQYDRPAFPFELKTVALTDLAKDRTVTLNELVQKLPSILTMRDRATTIRGLQIAKVFRNKEGHCVTRDHVFEPANYEDISISLRNLYEDAFEEQLSVRFSMVRREVGLWRVMKKRSGKATL